ncbi:glutathione S-transferase family protein [Labrys sp. 22185]|uniref:glutathione S-transferase family protein n=1 Tax=Labrys sp. 22185 TaxID=3453888 RepID=UPI003F85B447
MRQWRHYWCPGTGSLVVDVAFAWAGITPERILIDTDKGEQQAPDFLAVNPAAQVPAVILPSGTVLTETAAILLTIDEASAGAGLLPAAGSTARAISLRWLMFLATNAYPAALRTYYSDRFTADGSEAAKAAVAEAAKRDSERIFTLLANEMVGPFLLGDIVTIVDVYAAMIAGWHEQARALPAFRTLYKTLQAHPVIGPAWRQHEGRPD